MHYESTFDEARHPYAQEKSMLRCRERISLVKLDGVWHEVDSRSCSGECLILIEASWRDDGGESGPSSHKS